MVSSADYLSWVGVDATPPPQNYRTESTGVIESGKEHYLYSRVSTISSHLIHPQNLDSPGDYRTNDAQICSAFLGSALSADGNTQSITQLNPDDISMGLLFALFSEKPANQTQQARALEIIETYPVFGEHDYNSNNEGARQLCTFFCKLLNIFEGLFTAVARNYGVKQTIAPSYYLSSPDQFSIRPSSNLQLVPLIVVLSVLGVVFWRIEKTMRRLVVVVSLLLCALGAIHAAGQGGKDETGCTKLGSEAEFNIFMQVQAK